MNWRSDTLPRSSYAMLVFAVLIGLNALGHVVLSSIYRTYVPGLITALIVIQTAIVGFRAPTGSAA
jgi:ABC-type proline/glycine betaine transport system permease subunit